MKGKVAMKNMKFIKKIIPLVTLFVLSSCGFTNASTPAKKVDVESVVLLQSEEYVEKGNKLRLNVTVSPSDATNKSLTWSSTDTNVATVNDKGEIKAVSAGDTIIKVKSDASPTKSAYCYVTVVDEYVHPESLSLNVDSINLERGTSLDLQATISPNNATNKNLIWSSNNDKVSVDNYGHISALECGSSVVTAETVDGGLTYSCNVTVEETTVDQWTVLIYMCGSNLESDYANVTTIVDPTTGQRYQHDGIGLAVADIMEILAVPNKPDDINIVIETGGANEWTTTEYANYGSYNIKSDKLQRHHVENNKIVLDGELSYASMGQASTLKSFVQWGLNTYPAHKTALILWNHGGGLQGSCYDERKNSDTLEPEEVISGVSGALTAIGRTEKLELIGYDCCLMQVQDIANLNSQYFNYMVASQESESGTGWDYDTWVDDLYAHKDTGAILKALANGFIIDNGGVSSRYNDQTLSYLNLRHMEEYRLAWEYLAGELKSIVNDNNSSSFNKFVDGVKKYAAESYYYYGLFDAKNFLNKLETSTIFRTSTSSIIAAIKAHSKLVEYSICGKGAGQSYGLSMFWSAYSIPSGWWSNTTTYAYNGYGSDYGFPNWDYLNKTYGSTIEKSGGYYY